jgi:hypothetical protein
VWMLLDRFEVRSRPRRQVNCLVLVARPILQPRQNCPVESAEVPGLPWKPLNVVRWWGEVARDA